MAMLNLGLYWHRLGASPSDAPAHADGRHAIPARIQAAIDDGGIRSTRSTPGYEGRHRAEDRPADSGCICGAPGCWNTPCRGRELAALGWS